MKIITAWLPLLIIMLLLANGCSSQNDNDFGIYLPTEDMPSNQMESFDFNTVELQGEPFISIDDIITYSWDTHEIKLTEESGDRISSLRPPVTGTPFIVCVGSERVYGGAFWPSYSSASFDGIVIDPVFIGYRHSVQIQLGYPSSGCYSGQDTRSDSRIFDSLEHAGKLTNYQ